MSRLPNAPLIEVIFEIRWQDLGAKEINEFQYLHGDIYSIVKDEYTSRENLLPPNLPLGAIKGVPLYRFRKKKNSYPLFQLGLGLLTVNTIDEDYYWDKFEKEIDYIIASFIAVYPKSQNLKFVPNLTYIDFFPVNFEQLSSIDFINENLNLSIKQNYLKNSFSNLKETNLSFNYEIGKNILSLNIKDGNFGNNKDGIVLQTKLLGQESNYSKEDLSKWINDSHKTLSKFFKNIVSEKLYKTFK